MPFTNINFHYILDTSLIYTKLPGGFLYPLILSTLEGSNLLHSARIHATIYSTLS